MFYSRMKNVHLAYVLYVHYLMKIKHRISYFYNALLEQQLLHQAWCKT